MKQKIDFKTQTNTKVKFHKSITNISILCKNFQFGILNSKNWMDIEPRAEPLVELEIEGKKYKINLSEFIIKIKPVLKKYKAK